MRKWAYRAGWMAAGVAALYALSALAGVANGGPLDPPGPVGPTMKTLNDIPGTWSQKLVGTGSDSCNTPRFTCVLDTEGVRDNETGLVWETTPFTELVNWSLAVRRCGNSVVGGRGGWRLPTDAELRGLLDPNASGTPLLPDGHPFSAFGPLGHFWTISAVPGETDLAYAVDIDTLGRYPGAKTELLKRWCVRGVQADAPEDSLSAEEPPAWYQTLDATGGCFSARFRCVMDGEGVLDRETGLVWRISPDVPSADWPDALGLCQTIGSSIFPGAPILLRHGWRLPTAEESMSLFVDDADGLPDGHPFQNVTLGSADYWTATDFAANPTMALTFSGGVFGLDALLKGSSAWVWCVRGP